MLATYRHNLGVDGDWSKWSDYNNKYHKKKQWYIEGWNEDGRVKKYINKITCM